MIVALYIFIFVFKLSWAEVVNNESSRQELGDVHDEVLSRNKCLNDFSKFRCQEKIEKDNLENRRNYLDCNQLDTLFNQTFSCVKGGVHGVVDLAVGLVLTPVSPFLLMNAAIQEDAKCSADTSQKEEIAHVVKPLIDPKTYQLYLQNLSCTRLNQIVQQRIKNQHIILSEKRAWQKKYDNYLRGNLDPTLIAKAERLYPKSVREISEAEKEFESLYQKRQNIPSNFKIIYEKLRQDFKCASNQFLIEKACGLATGIASATFVVRKIATHGVQKKINNDLVGIEASETKRQIDKMAEGIQRRFGTQLEVNDSLGNARHGYTHPNGDIVINSQSPVPTQYQAAIHEAVHLKNQKKLSPLDARIGGSEKGTYNYRNSYNFDEMEAWYKTALVQRQLAEKARRAGDKTIKQEIEKNLHSTVSETRQFVNSSEKNLRELRASGYDSYQINKVAHNSIEDVTKHFNQAGYNKNGINLGEKRIDYSHEKLINGKPITSVTIYYNEVRSAETANTFFQFNLPGHVDPRHLHGMTTQNLSSIDRHISQYKKRLEESFPKERYKDRFDFED